MDKIITILSHIGFDWRVALANLVNFAIIVYILNKFLFSKVREVLKEREVRIAEGLENAQKAETELLTAETKKKEIIAEAKIEAQGIAVDAAEKGEKMIAHARAEAQHEANKVLKEADKEVAKRAAQVEKDLMRHTSKLVIDGVKKVLKEEVDSAMQERIVKRITS